MTSRVAPWLDGLDEAWEEPAKAVAITNDLQASSVMNSLRQSRSHIPRPSLGSHSSPSRQDSSELRPRTRNPLATLSRNEANTLRYQAGSMSRHPAGSRSVSYSSESFGMGTVQHRSKSSSPGKKQETLEWKRRLVQGNVGYGDHTDLFGPSGLENIFAPNSGPENEERKVKGRMRWLQQSDAATMPSSPPVLLSGNNQTQSDTEHAAEGATEQHAADGSAYDGANGDNSFRSNPFDLESSVTHQILDQIDDTANANGASSPPSSAQYAMDSRTDHEVAPNRTMSGQTELEQEDFSPVYISKRKTVSGSYDYAPLDSRVVKQFQKDLAVDGEDPADERLDEANRVEGDSDHSAANGNPEESMAADPNFSFSEDLPTGSPLPKLGTNVQFKRGGYSQQGSFKQRPLSPSPVRQTDCFGDESELPSHLDPRGQLPPAPTPPQPSTPAQFEQPKSRSSGSPLKLFAAHDTFTNDRLMRRMSQLNPDGTLRLPLSPTINAESKIQDRNVSNGSSFGNGQLDSHIFEAEITITGASDDEKLESSQGSPGSDVMVPGSKVPVAFRFEVSSPPADSSSSNRRPSKQSATASRGGTLERVRARQLEPVEKPKGAAYAYTLAQEPVEVDQRVYAEGKRPPTSPFKNPTPKRRRTLHASELEHGVQAMNNSYHSQLQDATGSRKRKDARHGETQNTADPDVLAQRKILRPRNPTPSQQQGRQRQIHDAVREATAEFVERQPEKIEAVLEQIESSIVSEDIPTLEQQAQTLASEVAAFTLKVRRQSAELGERKRSVTTQDFLNEAMTVMNLIRAKARPQSNLGSVEEAEAETSQQSMEEADVHGSDSHLRVSRPPSREGSGWRERAPEKANPRVISHLRKFQEQEDIDDTNFIANSIASLQVDDEERINDQVVVVDEYANVRITGPPPQSRKEGFESDSRPVSHRSQGSTLHTQDSSGPSTGRTLGTASTRKSDNVGTLAPDAVAHLIGEQVGGMTYDKDQQRWVRFSKSPEKDHGSFLELPSNVTSDDDPFREISDLPVDEQNELRRLSSSGRPAKSSPLDEKEVLSSGKDKGADPQAAGPTDSQTQGTNVSRPVTRESSNVQPHHSSSVLSRFTALASSQQEPKIETRATSWSNEELVKPQTNVEREDHYQSPALVPEVEVGNDVVDAYRETDDKISVLHHTDDSDVHEHQPSVVHQTPRPQNSARPAVTREMSLRKRTLTSKFNAATHEQSEMSFIAPLPGDRMISLSLSVSRPVSTWQHPRQVTELQYSPSKDNSSILLSDLPDFTIHEEDGERPSERALANRLAQHAASEINDRYAIAVKELVKILTDVKQDEPYWEDLKQLDLRGRSLSSLYGLNDFCTGIQDLTVSNNSLSQVQGLPVSVRRLDASWNSLSSLTTWNHLTNLQYLDVSSNHLDNLDGISGLIHLRELRADDNEIASIGGVFELDGLLKLRLRRNKINAVSLSHSRLERLQLLDVCDNQIASIDGLEMLPSLTKLKVDGNPLLDGLQPIGSLLALTSLSARRCDLSHLDVWWCPNLSNLDLDDNRLPTVEGLSSLRSLNTLSLRRQTLPNNTVISILDHHVEAREILLSGNTIRNLHLPHSLLNLQHLDLASVGLQELPQDFGLRMPNLRMLNLNFNSIKDIQPLLNIQRLERLTACGNRIHRLRKTIATLEKLSSLQVLDLRDNPLNQGFYCHVLTASGKQTSLVQRDRGSTEDVDEDAQTAEAERARYQAPPGGKGDDEQHRARLDEEIALRRRVYELLLANSCGELVEVDGLTFNRKGAVKMDHISERLLELGVLRLSERKMKTVDALE